MIIEGFLIGVITTASLTAGTFFLKFWRKTRDPLFLSFGAAFLIEGLTRLVTLGFAHPNEGRPWVYVIRLFASLLILTAIVRKNYGRGR